MRRLPRMTRSGSHLGFIAAAMLALLPPTAYAAMPRVALSGRVTSPLGIPMEGVLVSATRVGSTITTTVVSNRAGDYEFPSSSVSPGSYRLEINAIGYALVGSGEVRVRGGSRRTANLGLRAVRNIDDQMTNSEWLISMPGKVRQKDLLLNCTTCHTLERIVTSRFSARDFLGVMKEMSLFANQSFDLKPQMRLKLTESQ